MTVMTRWSRVGLGFGVAAVLVVVGATVSAQNGASSNRDKVITEKACPKCDISNESFVRLDLTGVNLTEANAAGASFYRTDLTNAQLAGADLSKANLSWADLTNANLGQANLRGANLAHAIGAATAGSISDETTTCPDGTAGPCR